jgi:hypothetical protein
MDDRRHPIARWATAAMLSALLASDATAQPPAATGDPPPPGAPAGPVCTRRGRLHRMLHHVHHTLEDDFIGYAPTFVEPPLGAYINRQFAVQVSKADAHRFTVYQTDFLPGTDRFSPMGAARFNRMFGRLTGWPGPILVDWSPDHPAVAEARRQAILATLAAAGRPMPADRVLIGPSPYPGALGTEAAGHYNNTVTRSEAAVVAFPLPPNVSANMGVR